MKSDAHIFREAMYSRFVELLTRRVDWMEGGYGVCVHSTVNAANSRDDPLFKYLICSVLDKWINGNESDLCALYKQSVNKKHILHQKFKYSNYALLLC